MQLTDEDVEEFQTLYERKFGTRIDKNEAHAKAINLIRLMEIVYRPLTEREAQIAQTICTEPRQLPTH
jgi:hypothetical protein